jgi:hypothetical protein
MDSSVSYEHTASTIKVQDSQVRKVNTITRMDKRASNLQLNVKNFSMYIFNNSESSGSCKSVLFNDALNWYVDTTSVTNE